MIKNKMIYIYMLLSLNIYAQNPISIDSAWSFAQAHNDKLRSSQLYASYLSKNSHAAYQLPNTIINTQYGQINSFYYDNQFSIQQNLSFPLIYKTQKNLLSIWSKIGGLQTQIDLVELKKMVYKKYYEMVYMQDKLNLLLSLDSTYLSFIEKSNARYISGETDILEKVIAETQRGQLNIQVLQAKDDYKALQEEFKWLLNADIYYVPVFNTTKLLSNENSELTKINNHPSLLILANEKNASAIQTKIEKNKLIPDFSLAFSTMSMKGVGADNVFYNYNTRFNSFQLGLLVPIFNHAQKNKIAASKIYEQYSLQNFETKRKQFVTEYTVAQIKYNKSLQTYNYYNNEALKSAKQILVTANNQFAKGEIDYLQWVFLFNQYITIQSQYIDAMFSLNNAIIDLNYFNLKQ